MKTLFTILLTFTFCSRLLAQSIEPFTLGGNTASSDNAIKKSIGLVLNTASFEALQPNVPLLANLSDITSSNTKIAIPLANGSVQQFYVAAINIMSPHTALLYPSIKTYDLLSIDGEIMGRLTYGPLGFNAMLLTPNGRQYITPINSSDNIHHVVYDLKDYDASIANRGLCGVDDAMVSASEVNKTKSNYKTTSALGDCQLRTYRMAIAATGEFTTVYGGNQTNAVNSITTTVANISLIYQRDAAITFTLVTNNNVIFTNAGSDPYSTVASPSSTTLNENQTTLDNAVGIGSSAYDLGLVFNAGWNGGLASTPAICNASNKGRGAGGLSGTPSGSVMENMIAHEAGHMFSALHTMSSGTGAGCSSNLTLATAYEPGGGSSIMAYAGAVCVGQSYQNNTDGYFHANSVNSIVTYAVSQSGCGITSSISNTAPTSSNSTTTYNIPKSTPFALTSTATDANATDVLSYQFDQYDLAASAMTTPPTSTATSGPVFRSYPPSTTNQRLFPPLANILANTTPTWEVLPSVARALNFKIIARDNKTGGGCRAVEDVTVNVDVASGPFVLTSQNTASSFTANGSNTMTVTWDVASTTATPVNAANVNILFSKDNGVTFPYTLVSNTPNDGTQTIIVPNINTGAGRIKIVPTNNIFFDINNDNVTIASSCLANGSSFTPTSNVAATEGNAALNLGLSGSFGSPLTITGTISNTDPLTTLSVVNVSGSNCANFGNDFYYETYTFQVNVTGTYTFAASGGTPFGTIYNLYSTSFTPSSPCTNFITSNGVYNGSVTNINASCSATLTAGVVYAIAIGTFSGSLPTLPFSYTINVTPPGGGALYSGTPPPGAGYSYTFAVVNGVGNVVGFTTNGDLTSVSNYPAGSYSIYGISYANAVNLNTYIGAAFTTLQADMLNSVICANQSSNSITVTINPYIWTGASSPSWNSASNWLPTTVPGANNTASIPATGVTNEPTVDAVKTLGHLIVANGRTVTINTANTLSVAGNITNNGSIIGTSKLILNGTAAQGLSGTGAIANLELNNSAGATIASGNKQNITGVLTLTSGTLTTNGGLSLKSSAGNDARIAQITSGAISGTAEVERYIPALNKRAWRLLSVPVSSVGAPTIYNSWQEGGANTANYGTQITNAGGAAVAGSWDAGVASGTSSIRQYVNASNTLTTPSGTNIAITTQPAWFLYVRGDRTVSGAGVSGNTTLRMTGNLITGNKDISIPATNFTLVGNPYVSPIDFSLARANVATTHTLNKFWVWDSKVGTNGGYVLLDGGLGFIPSVSTGSYPSATSIVQSGQAFFVQSDGTAGNFRIQEDDKASTYQGVFKTTNGTDPLLFVRLNINDVSSPGSFITTDGIIAAFNNSYSATVDNEDGIKLWNFGPNLSLHRDDSFLTIEKRPLPLANDTLHINVNTVGIGNYQLEFDGANFNNSSLDAFLIDNFLNTAIYLNLNTISTTSFSVTSNSLSSGNERFKIVFQNASPLSANPIDILAVRNKKNVDVSWSIAAEKNIHHYELQRSADGKGFQTIALQSALKNDNSKQHYSVVDTLPLSKTNYYRIKAVTISGNLLYSSLVQVSALGEEGNVVITPNPIQGNKVNLQFISMLQGTYHILIHNTNGKLVYEHTLNYSGGSSLQSFDLPHFAKGIYNITVRNTIKDIILKMIAH